MRRARQVIPLFVPLFVTSLRRAENMALAMDARAYVRVKVRTSMVELKFQRRDLLAALVVIAVIVAMALV